MQNGLVHIPARAFTEALIEAAKYSGKKREGRGRETWTKVFENGIMLLEDLNLGIKVEDVGFIDIFAHANGQRNCATRVNRRFPLIHDWETSFTLYILDPAITEALLTHMIGIAGTFKGLGRYRPEKRGTNGRFRLVRLQYNAMRQFAAAA